MCACVCFFLGGEMVRKRPVVASLHLTYFTQLIFFYTLLKKIFQGRDQMA